MAFRDRADAGRRLARALTRYEKHKPVVLALPRGGVPVAAEIAAGLRAPLDLVLVRKIGLPGQPELAMGAVADGAAPVIIRNEAILRAAGVEEGEFDAVCRRELAEIERRRAVYLGQRGATNLAGRIAIVVDDGIATGSTTRAALAAVRHRRPERIVLAVPVGPTDTLRQLREEVDDLVCLEEHEDLGAIGLHYNDFAQVSDEEVIAILARERPPGANEAAWARH